MSELGERAGRGAAAEGWANVASAAVVTGVMYGAARGVGGFQPWNHRCGTNLAIGFLVTLIAVAVNVFGMMRQPAVGGTSRFHLYAIAVAVVPPAVGLVVFGA